MGSYATEIFNRFITYVFNPAILLVFAAGFVVFMWGLVQFLMNVEDSKGRQEGLQKIIWGIVGLFIMVSIWGIIAIMQNTFKLSPANTDASRLNVVNGSIPRFLGN